MIDVEVTGGTKTQRLLTEQIVRHCQQELFPRIKNVFVEVQLKKDLHDREGHYGVMDEDDDRWYVLELDSSQCIKDFVVTLCHEMVHVKQYARRELIQRHDHYRWRKTRMSKDVAYFDRPWEKEAYELENKLAETFEAKQ